LNQRVLRIDCNVAAQQRGGPATRLHKINQLSQHRKAAVLRWLRHVLRRICSNRNTRKRSSNIRRRYRRGPTGGHRRRHRARAGAAGRTRY
jgi:hypothetical protein